MPNDHLDRAKSRLLNSTNNDVARAQAEATLALAHEQQTANLIAYTQAAYQGGLAVPPSADLLADLQRNVEKRLGLS